MKTSLSSNLKSFFFMLLLAAAVPLFAQDIMPPGMTNLMDRIVEIFTSDFLKGILIIFVCGCAVAYGFNKDNEKMKRNIMAIGIAIAILAASSQIVDTIWDSAASGN